MKDRSATAARWTLAGRRALLTGGTQGIGLAAAEELLGLGARLHIVARDGERLSRRIARWREQGHDAAGTAADVATAEGRERLLDEVRARWGELDLLVSNVGTNIRKKAVTYTTEEYESLLSTNLHSAFHLCRAAHPLLRAGQDSAVVLVVSVAGLTSLRTGAPYAMSKAALIQLARNLAVEWAPDGIRVNAVAPWYTRTPLVEPVLADSAYLAEVLARTPLGRIAEAHEVGAVIAFLCLPAASYVTGQCLAVDGGFLVHGF